MFNRIFMWLLIIALALYVPLWWYLVFGGYYDDRMSPEMLRHAKTFLPADIFLFGLFVGLISGLRRKKLWAYPCGFLICGAVTYMCIHGCIAMIKGTLPHDLATILIFLPYLLAAPVGTFFLYRDLRQSFEVSG